MQLKAIKKISGKIKLLTGLHIGGNKDVIEIGGIDSPVIKHAINPKLPYIPGSSIKGKMRFWLEWQLNGKIDKHTGEPHKCRDSTCQVCRIFGTTEKGKDYGPTRISVMDADLIKDDRNAYLDGQWEIEDKVENRINRLTGAATDPRHIERVPTGVRFTFSLSYKIFTIDDEPEKGGKSIDEQYWPYVLDALYFLQLEGLGGSVSRGYGRFIFEDMQLDGKNFNLEPQNLLIY